MTQQDDSNYFPSKQNRKRIEPLNDSGTDTSAAVDVIRQKIANLYEADEPTAQAEAAAAEATPAIERSKHQAYMHELSSSGRSLEEIQAAWHNYYRNLSDEEKHEVWQEFHEQHNRQQASKPSDRGMAKADTIAAKSSNTPQPSQPIAPEQPHQVASTPASQAPEHKAHSQQAQDVEPIRERLLEKVAGGSRKTKANLKSTVFGLSVGGGLMLILAFSFFNERFIAPFITPSTVLSSTPLIMDEETPVGDEARIIIPKINLDIPVIYDEESIAEDDVQRALEDGVLHYPITPEPGENGNSVFFGHSSNNILNRGSYKFAFVLLSQLEEGDTFMIEKDGQRYVYRVFDKAIVPPTDFSVLDPEPDKPAIATLITCDPPGTSINRLAVYGEQISPDPIDNEESTVDPREASTPAELPSDAPTLWDRVRGN